MAAPFVFICSLIVLSIGIYIEAINVDELNAISYHVDILNRPVLSGQQESSGSVMQITSRYGQAYQCSLPEISSFYGDESIRGGDGDPSTDPADLGLLLKPLEMSPCLTKTKDWWTYEFCYGKHIKQYHLEDNKIVSPIIVLGLYESEYNWSNESKADENSRNRLQRYHSQYYVNGSTCDITGTQRRSEVRFLCEDGSGDYIHHVDEPESCRYIVTIHTTKVCHHPYLRLPPNNEAQSIVCNPVLTSDQYEKYLIRENEKKAAVEEKRKAWLAKQEEQLLALKQSREEARLNEISESPLNKDETNVAPQGEPNALRNKETEQKRSPFETKIEPKESGTESGSKDDYKTANTVDDTTKKMFTEDVQELDKLSEKWRSLRDDIQGKMREVEEQMKQVFTEHASKDDKSEKESSVEHDILERLSSILKHLLQQVDKAELDTKKASHGLLNLQDYIESVSSNDENYDEVVTQKTEMEMEPGTEEKDDELGTRTSSTKPEEKYKKFSEILKTLKAKGREVSKGEQDKDDTMGEIEKALVQKLMESGIDTQGRKFEVKILTADYFENGDEYEVLNDDDDDDSVGFQTVLIKLMGDEDEVAEHFQHHNMLEKNYRFVWNGENEEQKKKKET